MVDSAVLNEHHVYKDNIKNSAIDEGQISYPSTNDTRVFEFIDRVRKHSINNALVDFKDFSDVENYLRKQWAGLMYEALTSDSEAKRVSILFESLKDATQNVQFMTKQLVKEIDNKTIQLNVEFYDYMLNKGVTHDLSLWGLSVSPRDIILYDSFDSIANNEILIEKDSGLSVGHGGPPYRISKPKYNYNVTSYLEIKDHFLKRLEEESLTKDEFLNEITPTKK